MFPLQNWHLWGPLLPVSKCCVGWTLLDEVPESENDWNTHSQNLQNVLNQTMIQTGPVCPQMDILHWTVTLLLCTICAYVIQVKFLLVEVPDQNLTS